MAGKNLKRSKKHSRSGGNAGGSGAKGHFSTEAQDLIDIDAPNKIIFCWDDETNGYVYDEHHPIAQRIGPPLMEFVVGLNTHPDYHRARDGGLSG
jgi:hypothetical protein